MARAVYFHLVWALPREIIIASEDWSTELRLTRSIFSCRTVLSLLGEPFAVVNAHAPPLLARGRAFCIRVLRSGPDSFLLRPFFLLSRALFFFRPLFIPRRARARSPAGQPVFGRAGERDRSTNGVLITLVMCITSRSGMPGPAPMMLTSYQR